MEIELDPEVAVMHRPGVLLVHLLKKCNLRCQHCYIEAGPEGQGVLPVQLVKSHLGDLGKLGIGRVFISGGEPFLYRKLPDVLRYITEQPNIELFVSTNGTLIRSAQAKLLKSCGATAQISIDGPPDYHDSFRGFEGAFKRATRGIQALVAVQVPVAVIITVCKDNLNCLPWLAEWAHGLGVNRISVQPLMQLGRGFEVRDRCLSGDELSGLFLQLSDLSHTYRFSRLDFSMSFLSRHLLLNHPCAAYVCNGSHCHRKVKKEIKKLVIREDGTVLPEIPTLDYRFALGNLHDGTLSDLVSHYFEHGYEKFDLLCRTVYKDVMPGWEAPLIPWNEIIAQRSKDFPLLDAPEEYPITVNMKLH